jgi:hypothetical protein
MAVQSLCGDVVKLESGSAGRGQLRQGTLSETRMLPSPRLVVPPPTLSHSSTVTLRPARAAYKAQAAPTTPAPTTTTSGTGTLPPTLVGDAGHH